MSGRWRSVMLFLCLVLPAVAAEPAKETRAALVPRKPSQVFHGEALNLATCYELALLRMETIGLSEEDIRLAQARYREAIGAILPSVKVVGEQYFYKDRNAASDLALGGDVVGSNDLQPRQARVNVKVPIFSGYAIFKLRGPCGPKRRAVAKRHGVCGRISI